MGAFPERRQRAGSALRPNEPTETEGIEQLRERMAACFLIGGSIITLLSGVLPGFLTNALWARLLILGLAAPVALGAIAVLRWGIPRSLVLPVALAGDVTVGLGTLIAATPSNATMNTASLAVLCLFAAMFGSRRDLIAQTVLSNVVLVCVTPLSYHGVDMIMFGLWSNFGLIVPAWAMFALRQRLIASNRLAQRLARIDPLTGLLNRRGLADTAPDIIRLAVTHHEVVGALVCDLDHFKRLNDTFGHAVGDEVLAAVATVLRSGLRTEDAVVRLGGEEFAVLAVMPPFELMNVAERIRADVAEVCTQWSTTVSIGAAWTRPDAHSIADAERVIWSVLDQADEYTYVAKTSGRNRVERQLEPN